MKKLALIGLVLAACGGEDTRAPETEMHIGFKAHELECTIEGKLEAKMQVAGVAGDCVLDVDANRIVSGVCENIPTGAARMFRLVYYIMIDSREVQLAVVITTVDLSGETRGRITVEFPANELITDEDTDGDRVSNIREVCMGRDPLISDS